MKIQKPTIGRVVLYQSYGTPNNEFESRPRLAHITDVNPDNPLKVDICVINPSGFFFNRDVNYGTRAGQWRYPERSDELIDTPEDKEQENDN